jgi:MerR family transcriptional regulator, copper efflux regulator
MTGLLIGEVARRAGVTPPTIRYYESIGLLAPPHRSAAGYRRYTKATLEELAFIRKAQTLGFSLDEIGEVLKLTRSGQAACSRVLSIAHQHLAAVSERITQLQRFRDQLTSELEKWDGLTEPTCAGLCRIVVTAADSCGVATLPVKERAAGHVWKRRT